ncbi:SdpI family protein [Flavobacterium sp. F-65]|uniref:SdpI family protein n=1 Tax=Flavobacterium pisciphilum TaxID=2893755 RepID=A0ABS8MS17_9FLAO|nr:SdpI family protein [Flavobacterium sp. F-65]MCC9071557.1 SdpI family protein [Flavobacterium sp. F-65]
MNTAYFVSILLLLVSIALLLFPPKRINHFYGYRTRRSKKNIENWKFSNRFAAIGMLLFSACNIIGLYITSLFIDEINKNVIAVILLVEFGVLFYVTEKKTSENEKKNNQPM